ncbi:hypothetical protein CYMTET_53059 [Cymbomonas tetramitiformis]|uniref:Transporter, major facilitator family protein n=1 Tax=Cymbomonas tetramitiformis TaxID=36881 RepID=A0AAE0BJ64_9CHLO|nr:hypothetical protein CYMTET_53059 [Cymbomonas tetramitiformis]
MLARPCGGLSPFDAPSKCLPAPAEASHQSPELDPGTLPSALPWSRVVDSRSAPSPLVMCAAGVAMPAHQHNTAHHARSCCSAFLLYAAACGQEAAALLRSHPEAVSDARCAPTSELCARGRSGPSCADGIPMAGASGSGSAVGNIGGGILGQRLYNRERKLLVFLMAATTFLGTLPILYLINCEFTEVAFLWVLAVAFLAGLFSCVTGSNVRALLLNVNAPETRGTVFALFNLMDDLGKGVGPVAVAVFIQSFGRYAAFNIAVCGWVVCAGVLALLAFTLERDEKKLQHILRSYSDKRMESLGSILSCEMIQNAVQQ